MVVTKTAQSRSMIETNPADNSRVSSDNLTSTRNNGRLSALSKSQDDETPLSSSIAIGVVHSNLENGPLSLHKRISESPK